MNDAEGVMKLNKFISDLQKDTDRLNFLLGEEELDHELTQEVLEVPEQKMSTE